MPVHYGDGLNLSFNSEAESRVQKITKEADWDILVGNSYFVLLGKLSI